MHFWGIYLGSYTLFDPVVGKGHKQLDVEQCSLEMWRDMAESTLHRRLAFYNIRRLFSPPSWFLEYEELVSDILLHCCKYSRSLEEGLRHRGS